MKISVWGLGYVGSVSVGCLAAIGHTVIGVDVNPVKVDMINQGQNPVIEAELNDLIEQGVRQGRIYATTNAFEAVMASDVSLICVGTPSADNGGLDLQYIRRVCVDIGTCLSQKEGFHTVLVRSTMLPGSTESVVIPSLEKASGQRVGTDIGVVFNPEFLREGTAVHDFYHPPFTVIGQYEPRGAEIAANIYQGLEAPLFIVPLRVAEMIKYANNAFHAVKVAFANEIGVICKQQGIDSHQVMDIFCMDQKLNLSAYYLKPGFAFGGSCLPKDLRALLYHAHHHDLAVPLLESILPSNTLHVRRGLDMILHTGRKKIGILGFSFKAGTDDLRESPIVELIEMLLGKGYQVRVYDANVSLARLQGANRAYIERGIPHIANLMCDSIEQVLAESEILVVGNKSPEFADLPQRVRPDQQIIDLVRISKKTEEFSEQYTGICW